MVRRFIRNISIQLAVVAGLSACAHGQQPTSEQVTRAAEKRDAWRKGRQRVYMDDFGELKRYRAANAQLKPPAATEKRVVFYGDSITDLWPLAAAFPGKPYVNRGISGQTTSQLLVRFRADVIALAPKAVVILAGTNDIAGNTGPISIEEIEGNFATMVELARAHGIRVVLSSVLPVHNYTRMSELTFPRPSARADRRAEQMAEGLRRRERLRLPRLRGGDGRRQGPAQARPGRGRAAPEQGRVRDHGAAGGAGDRQGVARRIVRGSRREMRDRRPG